MVMTHHEDGVWIDLREDSYLNDPALGYSACRALKSPLDWWFSSHLNTAFPKPPRDQRAFERGTATHCLFLDPPGTYDRVYGVVPAAATHPDYLDTIPQLVAACRERRLPTTYTAKADLIDRLVRADPKVKILEVARQAFFASGKRPISADDHARILLAHRMAVRSREELGLGEDDLTLADAFEGGLSELSCFWTDESGIRQRARFDKIKPLVNIDLKTISDWRNGDFRQSLLREMRIKGYIIQQVHYNEARRQLRRLVAEGKVFGGTKAQRTLLNRIAKQETWSFVFVFCKMNNYPSVRAIVFSPEQMGLSGEPHEKLAQITKAEDERRDALTLYAYHRELYGDSPGSVWMDPEIIWSPQHNDWEFSSVWNGEN